MHKSINSFFTLLTLIIFSACSSVQVTEEAVADQSVAGVSITSKSIATQAVLANAVVYFEYDRFNLTSKSIQALKGVSELMKRNSKITISIEGHADERGTREYNLALGQRRAESGPFPSVLAWLEPPARATRPRGQWRRWRAHRGGVSSHAGVERRAFLHFDAWGYSLVKS